MKAKPVHYLRVLVGIVLILNSFVVLFLLVALVCKDLFPLFFADDTNLIALHGILLHY